MCLLTGLSFHGSGRAGMGCPISLFLALTVILFSLVMGEYRTYSRARDRWRERQRQNEK